MNAPVRLTRTVYAEWVRSDRPRPEVATFTRSRVSWKLASLWCQPTASVRWWLNRSDQDRPNPGYRLAPLPPVTEWVPLAMWAGIAGRPRRQVGGPGRVPVLLELANRPADRPEET